MGWVLFNVIEINIIGTSIILQFARELKVKRVIYSSNASGYGRNSLPNNESQADDCLNPYSLKKLWEKNCAKFIKIYLICPL